MNINLEVAEQHAVQAYDTDRVQINSIIYKTSLIVSQQEIISDLPIKYIQDINSEYIEQLIRNKPELIIIGHRHPGTFPPINLIAELSQQQIGIECMSLGAACRTYNVLLSELRNVVVGFIL